MQSVAGKKNNPFHVIFQHGWGFTKDCWSNWLGLLPDTFSSEMIDRGYLYDRCGSWEPTGSQYNIVVCHSLGLHLVPKKVFCEAKMVVVISGFAHLHGLETKNFISVKHIKRMKRILRDNPVQLLNDFYRDCSYPLTLDNNSTINAEQLNRDLDILNTSIFDCQKLANTKPLLLHGTEDRIVPVERAYEIKQRVDCTLVEVEGAGHGLPFDQTQFCVDEIIKAINSQFS